MTFSVFDQTQVADLIERAGAAQRVTLVVGAGASVDAGLPSWEVLLDRLLHRAAVYSSLVGAADEAELSEWVEQTLRAESNLGAGAVVEALAGDELASWLREELYRPKTADDYLPGPIARQVAYLRSVIGDRLTIHTTNYDDLVEEALRERDDIDAPVHSYTGPGTELEEAHVAVRHLHGYVGRDETRGELVLSERAYHQMQQGAAWQQAAVGADLLNSFCLFVGSSLADPNLLRYLYAYTGTRRHSAVFVRQAEPPELSLAVRQARERATIARYARVNVDVVFVDHFADVAQLLHEIALRSEQAGGYRPLGERMREWIARVEDRVMMSTDQESFLNSQGVLNEALRTTLARAVETAEEVTGRAWGETLQLALWLVDESGHRLTNWAVTDRLHWDPRTVTPVPVDSRSRWVAVQALCRGASFGAELKTYASRWRYVLGLPLTVETSGHGLLPVGCVTVASMEGRERTILHELEDDVEAEFNRTVAESVLGLLGEAFK